MSPRARSWWAWCLSFTLASALFLLWPSLDLWVALHFYGGNGEFSANQHGLVRAVYVWVPRMGQALFVLALLGLVFSASVRWLRGPESRWRLSPGLQRRLMAWLLVVVLGVGLVVHEALKNQVGRPRPIQVEQMGGAAPFVPVFTWSPYCQRNCSFVSGHAAIGFSLMALGMWAAPSRRRRLWWIGTLVGTGVGLVRVMQGDHFLSDIVYAGLAIWGTSLLVHGIWLRWLARRRKRRGFWQRPLP